MNKVVVINDKRVDAKFDYFNEVIEVEASISILRKKMGLPFRRPKMTSNGFYMGMGHGYMIATPSGANKTKLVCCFSAGRQLEWLGKCIHKAEKKQAKLGR